jgi:isoquinoline 1-oxidoreductase beta subunit
VNPILNVTRRGFLKTGAVVGGGLVLGFWAPILRGRGTLLAQGAPQAPVVPDAFIRIGRDETVTIMCNKSEMGQGVYTSIPMLIVEELECDWKNVRVEAAPVDPVYNNPLTGAQMTGGSTSIRTEWDHMRKIGAAAREMLIAAAADVWKVEKATCRAENGKVVHGSGKSLTYGQLADKAAEMPIPKEIRLKDPSTFKIVGKPGLRLDSRVKVDGRAVFGLDATVPHMLIALLARPPVFGGRVKSFDGGPAKAVPGVKEVVQTPSGVAVVADGFWSAKRGRDALHIAWDEGAQAGLETSRQIEEYDRLARTPGKEARREGDAEKVLGTAAKRLVATYEVPYLANTDMEPLNCLVDLRSDSCEIWVGTQAQTLHRNAAAEAAGLKPEQVKLHTTFLGGGFGRRGNPHSDFVVQAVEVAKAVKKPVKLVWTREDDTRGGYFRPLWYDRIAGGLDRSGNLTAWRHTIVGQSIMRGTQYEKRLIKNGIDATSVEGAADMPYEIPHLLVDLHSPELPVTVQWWRSVGHSHTGFVVESFIDEMAHAAGADPYEFRRGLLTRHPRHRGVLDLAAKKAGWGAPPPPGRARGIAVCELYGSFVAEVAEVSVSPPGDVHVHRVVCAVDCGRTVNPATIEAQMESGIVFGLSAALHGAITLRKGRVEQGNFNDYPVLRMNEMPVVEVHIVPSSEAPGGVGEPATAPIAPAVTNAVFAATGTRIRRLPIGTVGGKKG